MLSESLAAMYFVLDKFFFVFHSGWILFVLLGWLWRRTRKLNLILIGLTAFSWFFLGIWYGYGYCPCTDWHWQVRMHLGQFDMPSSYIGFLIESMTGLRLSRKVVDVLALAGLLTASAGSLITNIRDRRNPDKFRDQT